jgi:hypothetical protein
LQAQKTASPFLCCSPILITDAKGLALLFNPKHLHQIKLITNFCLLSKWRQLKTSSENKERVFSVELKSKSHLKNVTLTNGSNDRVLIEGTIGELVQATFAEGIILEVVGKKGVLTIDLGEEEIKKTTSQNRAEVKRQ